MRERPCTQPMPILSRFKDALLMGCSQQTPLCLPIQDPRALSMNTWRLGRIYSLTLSQRSVHEPFGEPLGERSFPFRDLSSTGMLGSY